MMTLPHAANFRRPLAHALAGFTLAVSVGGAALADDTEVFFPPSNVTDGDTVRPNIMFIMDTSGSMSGTDGKDKDRLERVQEALITLLGELNQNVNVGLMRLSDDEGGPVLFPVSHIDASAESIEAQGACTVAGGGGSTRPPLIGYADGESDWAYELTTSGTVQVGDALLVAGGTVASGGGGGGASTTLPLIYPTNRYDDDEEGKSGSEYYTNDNDLDLAEDGDVNVGVRFDGLDVPVGATIVEARVTFAQTGFDNQHDSNTRINVTAHYDDDSPRPNGGWDIDNLLANDTSQLTPPAEVLWEGNFQDSGTDALITTPNLASVVQKVVDHPSWAEGNAITLLFEGLQGHFSVWSYDGSENDLNLRPRLEVSYQLGPVVTEPATAGLRFTGLNIPQGATISSATLRLTPTSDEAAPANMKVVGELSDDSPLFEETLKNLTNRTKTANSTDISSTSWLAGQAVDIDVTAILQEIADQSGWCGGNALSLLVQPGLTNAASRSIENLLTNSNAMPQLTVGLDATDPQVEVGCQAQQVFQQVADDNNDAEQEDGGNVRMSSPDLDIQENPYIGLRFEDIRVLRDAEILEARIEFTAESSASGSTSIVDVHMEKVEDAAPIQGNNNELGSRFNAAATAGVEWNLGDWTEEQSYSTPNLKDIVQEVVNQANWRAGNDVLFLLKEKSGARRGAYTTRNASKAPRLIIVARGGDPTSGSLKETVRDRLISIVQDFDHTGFTPLAEVLTEAAYYFRGDNVYFGRTRGSGRALNSGSSSQDDLSNANRMRISHCASYTGGEQVNPNGCSDDNPSDSDCEEQYIKDNPVYRTPLDQACQSNNIVMLSDGEPNNNTENGLIADLIGSSSCTGSSDGRCGIDLARWMNSNDQSDTLAGDQLITTYTIGFGDVGSGVNGADFLKDVAAAGGGAFFEAGDSADLVQVFKSIVAEILDKNTTFVAPAVTINAFNRLTHLDQLYFALFRPTDDISWDGNLKRFRLAGNPGRIVDQNDNPAVDDETGFFFEDVFSFWTDPAADPDGGNVARGGAAAQMPSPAQRNVYTNVAGSTLTAAGNRVHKDNGNITTGKLGLGPLELNERNQALDWARGVDVNDEDADGSRLDARRAIGDPLHSEPVLVSYGGTEADPDLTIFMGTNEGFIHAFDSKTGKELFSFIPEELLDNLTILQRNIGNWNNRPYGMDGPLVALQQGVGPAAKTRVVAGMRRGGRSYYALDVTNRTSPTLAWSITGGVTSGFNELGQSWSTPVATTVSYGGSPVEVLIFGGGYDTNQDQRKSLPLNDSMGRGVFMVRADNGQLLWSAGNPQHAPDLEVLGMVASVPSGPAVIDLDDDGLADRIYVTDTNANLFRFDIDPENTGRNDFASGGLLAALNEDTLEDNRRVYNTPDVALVLPGDAEPLLTISFGSGFRAHPLETGVRDRFYTIFDRDTRPGETTSFDDGPVTDPATQLYDATDNKIGSSDRDVADAARAELQKRRGAFIEMRDGEKVLTTSRTFNNRVIFATFEPGQGSVNVCAAGQGISRLYVLDVLGFSPASDLNNSGDITTADRDKTLALSGIPPNPVILFPESDGGPIEPVVFVGPEAHQPGFTIQAEKTTWTEQDPWDAVLQPPAGGQ